MPTSSMPCAIAAQSCSDIELKVATTRHERQAAFELVYHSYLRAGLCAENSVGLRYTEFQMLPTTDIIIAKLRGEVISTLSLVRDGELGLPMEEIYPEEVAARRASGVGLAEVSCLADRRKGAARFFGLFREMTRLMAQLGTRTGVDELLVAVHPRHAALYRRYMAFRPVGDRRNYPSVLERPAVALHLNFDDAKVYSPKSWNEFFAVPLPDSALKSCPVTAADRDYFALLMNEPKNNCPASREAEQFAVV
jgi:hypothetical protein